jgi:PAS domain S-box-containing protein
MPQPIPKKSAGWYQRLMETTQAIPWEMDPASWCFTHMGPQIVALLGYPLEQWYTDNFWLDHLHPDDRSWAPTFCKQAAAKGQDHELEYRMLAADGRSVWIRDVVSVVVEADGSRKLQGFLFDISQRKHVEGAMQALATSAPTVGTDDFFFDCVKNLAAVYNARFAFIGLLRENHQQVDTLAVWAGDGIAENFTYELEGTPCNDVLDRRAELIPSRAAELYREDELLVQMGVDSYFGAPLVTATGKTLGLVAVMDTKPMELSEWTAPILGMFATRIAVEKEKRIANRELRQLNQSLERRVAERTAELEALNKELESFSYSVSHDLRAPLRAIDGFGQALLEDYAAQWDKTAQDYLQRILVGSRRMGQLIDDMLGLSRVTRRTLRRTQVNLGSLAQEAVAQLQQAEPERAIRLVVDDELTAHCDPDLLRIALTNLLHNAWKYTAKQAQAHIELRHHQNGTTSAFMVRDNGVGFDMQHADKLFTAFQRLHADGEFQGTGIGLATVARVIHRHGGRVWAESEPDQGATFYFTLP